MSASHLRFGRMTAHIITVAAFAVILSSCQLAKNQIEYDRAAEMERQDYIDGFAPVPVPEKADANIPDFQSVLSTPQELRLPSPLVTVSVNQTVSLRDLIFELAEQANVDIEMDPQIRGSIIFTAKDKPFNEVVERICEMSGLRYRYENNVLRIELDRPFVKNYSVDYVNAQRTGESSVSTDISLSTVAGDTAESTGGGGSSSGISTSIEINLWDELAENIEQILTSSDTYISLSTLADPVAMAMNPSPVPPPVSADPNVPPPPPLPGSPQVAPMPAAAAPVINISTPAAEPLVPNPPATFSISRQSGTLSVFANQRQQKLVEKFLAEFKKRTTTQVLIEAKVLQVDLKDEFATGIDWQDFNLFTGYATAGVNFARPALTPETIGNFTFTLHPNDFNVAVDAIKRFGTVRALSSPRVTVLNNQPAIVNVAQNVVYFNFDVETESATDTTGASATLDSEQLSIPEGVLLNVLPTANPDTGEVLLVVRPTVSKITSSVSDPTVPLSVALAGIDLPPGTVLPTNSIPQVSIQEIDSILRIQSGQMIVMGGLMRDSNSVENTGVPILSDVPVLGHAFKSSKDRVEKSELVIFIKATIVPAGYNADDMDRKVYKKFGQDRRPSQL